MEPLKSAGSITAIRLHGDTDICHEKIVKTLESAQAEQNHAIIASEENDNALMVFNGDYTLENVWLDCRNVRLGVWVRHGTLTLKNCRLIGDSRSSTSNGVVVAHGATCVIEKSTIHNFAAGIVCGKGGKVQLKNATVSGCRIGICFNEESRIDSEVVSTIRNCLEYGAFYEASNLSTEFDSKKIVLADFATFRGIIK